MPLKDREQRRAYMRAWYMRPENRQRVIDKVEKTKRVDYGGVCVNCGGRTIGASKSKPGSAWCGKPKCASAARKPGTVPAFLLQEVLALAAENEKLEAAKHLLAERVRELQKMKIPT